MGKNQILHYSWLPNILQMNKLKVVVVHQHAGLFNYAKRCSKSHIHTYFANIEKIQFESKQHFEIKYCRNSKTFVPKKKLQSY